MAITSLQLPPAVCPCEECICLAMCKHKLFEDLVEDCTIIQVNLQKDKNYSISKLTDIEVQFLKKLCETLKPTRWLV